MKQGRYIKEKKEYIKERFTTKEGLFEFFTATAIWYFLIVKYIKIADNYFYNIWVDLIQSSLISHYFTYLTIGIIFTVVGLFLSMILIYIFDYIMKKVK